MTLSATHADQLRIEVSATEVVHLTVIGAIHGVVPVAVAALGAPGVAIIRAAGEAGNELAWQAPGSANFGPATVPTADGVYLLEDGDDPDKWLRVQVYTASLSGQPEQSTVYLTDRYANGPPYDDVTAAEAAAGDVATYTLTLTNDGTVTISQLVGWIDAAVTGLEISDDGAAWVAPTTEAAGLALADVAPASSVTLHCRRTIAGGAPVDADILTLLHLAYSGL